MKKRALLVGINYLGTGYELAGCINDSNNMHSFLSDCGFTDIEMVLESAATTDGIIAALNRLTSDVEPGDIILFHYSGHGSQLPSTNEPDGFEEIICPVDLDWDTKIITDDTLREIFNKVPVGVNTTVILDCCHSGTMLDQTESLSSAGTSVNPPTKNIRIKKGARYLKPPTKIARKLKTRSLVKWEAEKDINESALLIAGCQANQTSADAFIDGMHQGAATAAMLKVIRANPDSTYRSLVTGMRTFMLENNFSQVPELDGSSKLYDIKFLGQFPVSNTPVFITPDVYPITDTAAIETTENTAKALAIIGTLMAIILIILIFG